MLNHFKGNLCLKYPKNREIIMSLIKYSKVSSQAIFFLLLYLS